ncbi:hypothetical protein [Rhodoligotrophos defluvii]|uniref:hypothetical protein n=1 Tax=Rhodoligotrophos defluvii TaxID=2561934 RepID=UPI0010CA13FA|nr:hypothetical protein [Rhodoligotrophos defluvii]
MYSRSLLKLISAICAATFTQLYPISSHGQSNDGATPPNVSGTIQLPRMTLDGLGLKIYYNFTKKENTSSLDRNTSAEHFNNRIFRLFEDNKIAYGLYAFDGDPERDDRFTGYYLNFPNNSKDKVLYIQIDYDNKTRTFKERIIMPDGKKLLEEGRFEIVTRHKP